VPRRRPVEVSVSHERWLVSYADFITLLFAFFVVMYSISQVNQSKYRVLSDTLLEAFSDESARVIDESARVIDVIQVGELSRSSEPSVIDTPPMVEALGQEGARGQPGDGAFDKTAELPQLSDMFEDEFADLIVDEQVLIHSNEFWLEIELKAGILFDSANAEPSVVAESIFSDMAQLLKGWSNPVQVEGFTDNVPINNSRFPSNWELSAARASSVVKLLMKGGVAPERLSAVGYGEFQPVASNTSAEGRTANRRVVLMVARERSERPRVAEPERLDRAVNPVKPLESSPFPQPGLATTNLEPLAEGKSGEALSDELLDSKLATDAVPPAESEQAGSDRLDPVGGIAPVELEGGGLLFSSDPDLPRN